MIRIVGLLLVLMVGWPPSARDVEVQMANLVSNGTFDSDLTGWDTAGGVHPTWAGNEGNEMMGCAAFAPEGGAASELYQEITVATAGIYRLEFATKFLKDPPGQSPGLRARLGILEEYVLVEELATWEVIEFETALTAGTHELKFSITQGLDAWVDDVVVESVALTAGRQGWFRHRLMSERGDVSGVLHTEAEYIRVIEEAVEDAPRTLWPTKEDESLSTTAGQEEYDLSGITDLARVEDVLGVYLRPGATGETVYQDWTPVGFSVYDNAGSLVLRFDRPWATGFTIRVYYRAEPTQPSETEATDLNWPWLVAECMVRLLMRRPVDLEAAERVELMRYWTERRDKYQRQARVARPPRRAVTQHWPLR